MGCFSVWLLCALPAGWFRCVRLGPSGIFKWALDVTGLGRQNLGQRFGGILNASAQAWRCVSWSMPQTYLLQVAGVARREQQVDDVAWWHGDWANMQHADVIMFRKWNESCRRGLHVYISCGWTKKKSDPSYQSWTLTRFKADNNLATQQCLMVSLDQTEPSSKTGNTSVTSNHHSHPQGCSRVLTFFIVFS